MGVSLYHLINPYLIPAPMLTTLIIILLSRNPKVRLLFGIKKEPVPIRDMRIVRIAMVIRWNLIARNKHLKLSAIRVK